MVIALDTNALVRIFIDDPAASHQMDRVRRVVSKSVKVYIAQTVQVELVWVLKSAYQFKKADIIKVLHQLASHSIFELQRPDVFAHALAGYQQGAADFADYLVLAEAEHAHIALYTFDKKLIRSGAKEFADSF